MPIVHLSTFIQHPSRRVGLVGERDVELPCPPFVGLEIVITEVEHFHVAKVAYDITTGAWFAEEEDSEISDNQRLEELGLPPETLEGLQEILKEAGFSTRLFSLEGPDAPPRHRHLRLVRHNE